MVDDIKFDGVEIVDDALLQFLELFCDVLDAQLKFVKQSILEVLEFFKLITILALEVVVHMIFQIFKQEL